MTPASREDLRRAIAERTTPERREWLEHSIELVAKRAAAIAALFPAVGRKVGDGPLDPDAEREDVHAWTIDDAARTLLLIALGERVGEELEPLYRHGDAGERRGVLRALPFLPVGDSARQLVEDAIRTNDARLIAAALGPYAFLHLDDAALAQGMLKCVFVGIPLRGLEGLEERATPELARMLARYAHERIAAGRDVTPEIWPLIDRYPPVAELAALAAELEHPSEERRHAARVALDHRSRV